MKHETGLELLADSGWLANSPEAFRAALLPLARWRRYDDGDLITLGGEDHEDLIGVAAGTVALTSTLGPPATPVMHMLSGVFWLGYGPILREGHRNVTATARGEVWAANFSAARIRAMLTRGELDWRPFVRLAMFYGDTTARIAADLLIRSSTLRCIAVLARLAGINWNGPRPADPVVLPVTQVELAGACNLSRNAVGAILRGLAEKGLVEVGYRDIRILNPTGLHRMTADGGES